MEKPYGIHMLEREVETRRRSIKVFGMRAKYPPSGCSSPECYASDQRRMAARFQLELERAEMDLHKAIVEWENQRELPGLGGLATAPRARYC